ncbi:hypothetical protein BD413DRAFT_660017 [Trametes elegans]|nr:hypothetical protein BD413DRAFT_660017 [Trametes elegans]
MFPWSLSWLPSLPSIDLSLPSGIQKRFISFALRQSLGHLLKPGQLDVQQVDSQIGSGYVQVRDLELNDEAINALISGLPIRLRDGSVGKVTARIPWPNPLTSSIGLSLESLHLTFYRPFTDNLAESVVSVAETFIHEELSAHEEATLRESFHSDIGTSALSLSEDNVPGGLDPFISEEDVHQHDADPPGVSIFATLIERLLARFQITLVNPQEASFTLVSQGRPHTPAGGDSSVRKVTITGLTVTSRCLRPSGRQPAVNIDHASPTTTSSTKTSPVRTSPEPPSSPTTSISTTSTLPGEVAAPFDNEEVARGGSPPPRGTPSPDEPPSSPYSDSSDMDEETQMFMSQSIAVLPPRPVSPASSVGSSMYQSAISTTAPDTSLDDIPEETSTPQARSRTTSPTPLVESASPVKPVSPFESAPSVEFTPTEPIPDEPAPGERTPVELTRVDPIPFNPSPIDTIPGSFAPAPPSLVESILVGSPPQQASRPFVEDTNRVRVNLTMGVLRSIADIAELWSSHSPVPSPTSQSEPAGDAGSPLPLDDVEAEVRIRGIVLLMLSSQRTSASNPDDALTEYFSRPLVPPRLPHGFTRVHVEGISSSLSIRRGDTPKGQRVTSRREARTLAASLTISEISAFAILPPSSDTADLTAVPVLVTDPHLPSHTSLPTFDIVDWTDPKESKASAKLSLWRVKPAGSGRPSSQAPESSSPPSQRPIPVLLPSSPGRLGLAGLSVSPSKGTQTTSKVSPPALSFKFRSASGRPKDRHAEPADVQVNFAPIHVFLDLDSILGPTADGKSEVLRFVEELAASSATRASAAAEASGEEADYEEDAEEGDYRPSIPRVSGIQAQRELEAERERRRLEQLVLEDLDLGYDYRPQETLPQLASASKTRRSKRTLRKVPGPTISVNMPAIRVEVRVPPPAQRFARSGSVILDIHDLCLTPGRVSEGGGSPRARFGVAEDLYGGDAPGVSSREKDNIALSATWKRIVVSHSLVRESKARAILSLGPLTAGDVAQSSYFGVGTPPARDAPIQRLQPQLVVRRTPAPTNSPVPVNTTTISLDIPSVHVELSKPLLDGLQLWADDLTQLMEAASAEPALSDADTEHAGSANSSLIGSRYFARTNTMRSAPDSGATSLANTIKVRQEPRSETAVKVMVTEVAVRLLVPREEDGPTAVRPFDLSASDVDVLLELKPEGKDETVVTVGVMDLSVHDQAATDRNCFLSLTTPRSLNTTVKSALKLRFTSLVVPETTAKESRVRLTLDGITYHFYPHLGWATNLAFFFKAPPGAFESVVPTERTRITVKVIDTSIRLLAPSHPGALVPYIGELDFSTVIEGNSPSTSMNLAVPSLAILLIDDTTSAPDETDASGRPQTAEHGVSFWKSAGYALLLELSDFILSFKKIDTVTPPDIRVLIDQGDLRLHMCADTMGAMGAFIGDFSSAFKSPTPDRTPPEVKRRNEPADVSKKPAHGRTLLSSIDDQAFRRLPEVGAAPDMIEDDLPTNPDYLDESFGAAAGLRELSDDEFDESEIEGSYTPSGPENSRGVASSFGGETIRMLRPEGLSIVENYFETLPPDLGDSSYGETTLRVRVHDFNVTVFLYDGYDWIRTRRIIEEKAKEMRRKLAKIRQLVASGQTPDPSVEETNALLFNSVYIGLEHNVDELEPGALIAAIDEELNEDFETTTQSSWQSLKPQPLASPGRGGSHSRKAHRRRLRRAKGPSIEFRLLGLDAEVDNYRKDASLVSRILAIVKDVEILDHIKTSTWKKFLTSLQTDSRGNVRESDSNMVRVELRTLHPVPGHPSEEARLRAKILPLRLHVDQDALDFLKQFFSFQDPDAAPPAPSESSTEIYFQQAEVFPIDLKLDYKPRRVDYRALREGRTIELMNFFHFDGAEMTLRHITLNGITGWPRFFDLLNDLWTPDVKATQLVDVISGVAPIRSVVNVGSGVADLVLLPIAQYKKDGRVVRGLQKGANAFVKSTAMEAIKLGARLATGTQVILEQAETVLGGQFKDQVTAEAMQIPAAMEIDEADLEEDPAELISKYADQPTNVKEGVRSAYKSLKRNLNSAAQTILAVPMEVYERSGNEVRSSAGALWCVADWSNQGPVRAVVRAVPIAVLKPMIGASEAVSKTLLGLQNTLDPNIRQENEAKYKQQR